MSTHARTTTDGEARIEIKYAVTVRDVTHDHTVVVDNRRAAWNPAVAFDHAYDAATAHHGDDVSREDVRVICMGEPDAQFEETWGVPL